jgi:hypothetical protein
MKDSTFAEKISELSEKPIKSNEILQQQQQRTLRIDIRPWMEKTG